MIDVRLEKLSDDIRKGIPVSLIDALQVIQYQEQLKQNKKKSFLNKLFKNYATKTKFTGSVCKL